MMQTLNYRHLYYFWVVAKEGGVARAAKRLDVAIQTVSTQLSLLEQYLGHSLVTVQGRRLNLTEAGRVVLGYADQIFLLGDQLREAVDAVGNQQRVRFTVGISDVVPKLIAYHLLESVTSCSDRFRLVCHEGTFESLLADLALNKLDILLTDRPINPTPGLRVFCHPLGECRMALYASRELALGLKGGFPSSLEGAPFLVSTRNNALRGKVDQWLFNQGLHPEIVGEFEDSALMKTFGGAGMGIFPGPLLMQAELEKQMDVVLLGEMEGVSEQYFAVSNERRIRHPGVERLLTATHSALFGKEALARGRRAKITLEPSA